MQKQSIGNFLATLRRAKGMTQQEVADRLGISNRTLSAWETDKAYPDILLLPALADLYGVTADEIVRGERRPQIEQSPEEQTELSEKSLTRVLKNRHARFVTQACALAAALCASAVVIFFGALFLYHIAGLVFCILGYAAFIVCAGLFIAFTVGAWNAAEGETQASANYRLCVAHTVFIAYSVCALCLLLLGVGLFLISVSDYEEAGGISLSFLIAALALFVGGILTNASALKKYGSDKQKEAKLRNAKRYSKTALFGLIPLVVGLFFIFGSFVWTPQTREVLFSGDASGLTAYAETLVAEQDSYLCWNCGVPAGEYPLDISGKISRGEYLDDGGILIEYSFGEATLLARKDKNSECLELYYVDGEAEWIMCVTTLVTVGDASFYPVRTAEFLNEFEKHATGDEGIAYMSSNNVFLETYSGEEYGVRDGVYMLEWVTSYDIRGLGFLTGGFVILVDLIVCISVCAIKREKIKPIM